MYCLGIDTSNYTTSVAAVSDGSILLDARVVLQVKEGARGLQQSQALFQHWENLPGLIEQVFQTVGGEPPAAIAASARPRGVEGSYMPVFNAGMAAARMLAAALRVPLYETDHQSGHMRAGWWPQSPPEEPYLAMHLSGGTTEVLAVEPEAGEMHIDILGGTQDLNAGQFIDRVGVALGLPFPAGPHLEAAARGHEHTSLRLPVSVRGMTCSFSGVESAAQRMIQSCVEPGELAMAVQICIARTLERLMAAAHEKTGLKRMLIVGGVASNAWIRAALLERAQGLGMELHYAQPSLSRDNAVGVAAYALEKQRALH